MAILGNVGVDGGVPAQAMAGNTAPPPPSSLAGRGVMDWTQSMMIAGGIFGLVGVAGAVMISNTVASVAFGACGLISIAGFFIAQRAAEAIQMQDSINHLHQQQTFLIAQTSQMAAAEKRINIENAKLMTMNSRLEEELLSLEADHIKITGAYQDLGEGAKAVRGASQGLLQNLDKLKVATPQLESYVGSSTRSLAEYQKVTGEFSQHVTRLTGTATTVDQKLTEMRKLFDPFTKYENGKVPQSDLTALNEVKEFSDSVKAQLTLGVSEQRGFLTQCTGQFSRMDECVLSLAHMQGELETISETLSERGQQIAAGHLEGQREQQALTALIEVLSQTCGALNTGRSSLGMQISAFQEGSAEMGRLITETASAAEQSLTRTSEDLIAKEANLLLLKRSLTARETAIQLQTTWFVNICAPVLEFFDFFGCFRLTESESS